MSNSNVNVNVNNLARGLVMSGKGELQKREGTALACVAMTLLLSETVDTPNIDEMLRYMQGVHVNAKNEPEVFEASWTYWKAILAGAKQSVTFDTKTAKEEEDLADRREANTSVGMSVRTLRDACAMAYAFHACKVDWNMVKTVKTPNALAINQENALRLFGPKKEKMIEKMHLGIIIDTYGQFNFKALIAVGNERLVAVGSKPAPRKPEEKRTPVGDSVRAINKAIEDADTNALKANGHSLLALAISIIDRLNDVDMGDAYIPTSETSKLRDIIESKVTSQAEAIDAKLKASLAKMAA